MFYTYINIFNIVYFILYFVQMYKLATTHEMLIIIFWNNPETMLDSNPYPYKIIISFYWHCSKCALLSFHYLVRKIFLRECKDASYHHTWCLDHNLSLYYLFFLTIVIKKKISREKNNFVQFFQWKREN